MTTQNKLVYDDEFDALSITVANSDKTVKEVAQHLWPDMKPESAYARLKACLNPHGDQRLTFGQVKQVMKFCGQRDALYWLCDELDNERPKNISREDRQAALVNEFNRKVDELNRLAKELHVSGLIVARAAG